MLHPNDTGLYSNIVLGDYWFPTNNKSDLQKGWDNMHYQLTKTFFKNIKEPYIFYTSVKNIKFLESQQIRLDKKTVSSIDKKGLHIFLWEACSTYDIRDEDEVTYKNHEFEDLDYIRVQELDSIQKFTQKNNLKNVKVYTPNYGVKKYYGKWYPDLDLVCSPVGWIYPATVDYKKYKPNVDDIKKHFWCGNWRYAAHRHLIASYLVKSQSESNLSWPYISTGKILTDNLWFDINKLKYETTVLNGADELGKLAPVMMDIQLEKAYNLNEYKFIHINTNPKDFYDECFCAIVTETRFAEMTGFLTEKIMNAMLNAKPFIMVGPPGNLNYMRKWGFKTFDRWWDESYDLEQCHYKRIDKILDLLECIGQKSISELKNIYIDMMPIIEHNQNRIKELQKLLLEKPITQNSIFEGIRYAD